MESLEIAERRDVIMNHGKKSTPILIVILACLVAVGLLLYRNINTVQGNGPTPSEVGKTEENKTEENKTEENKTEENKTEGNNSEAVSNGKNPASGSSYSENKPENWNGYLGNDPTLQEHPTAPETTWVHNLEIPEYSGEAYIVINGGVPFFDTEELTAEVWEMYYDLDDLGRCTLADAVAGQETMPTEKRGSISSVKPTGWHTDKYSKDLVNGESLYNRCHLIAFGLCGETANKYNLITGTRYFNTDGINDLENMVIEYIRETDNHVRYRVTPVFSGDNLVADGQLTEAWSIEDKGQGICFCVYSYNVQPGINIDYATGDNWLVGDNYDNTEKPTAGSGTDSKGEKNNNDLPLLDKDYEGTFVLNVKKMKIHTPDCEAVANMSDKNRKDYTGSYNELIRQGYQPDPTCLGD